MMDGCRNDAPIIGYFYVYVIFHLIPSNLTHKKGESKMILKESKRILSKGTSDKFLKMKCIN